MRLSTSRRRSSPESMVICWAYVRVELKVMKADKEEACS